MKTWRWFAGCAVTVAAALVMSAQSPEPSLPRPGAILIADVTGQVSAGVGDERKPVKAEDRVRVGSTIATGRKSIATIMLSNGAILNLGAESELEIEEFGQATVSGSLRIPELKEEPTISRTRIRLVRGGVAVQVKPLKVSRGSSFHFSMLPGTLRISEGEFRAMVQMSDLGLGVCTLEFRKGVAEFELVGGAVAPVPVGRKLAFALEVDSATGAVKISEMPKETPPAKE